MSLTETTKSKAQSALLRGYVEKFAHKEVDVQDAPSGDFHAFRGICEGVRMDTDGSFYCVVKDGDDNAFCPDVSLVTVVDN